MVFSSISFLFFFLPAILFCYYLVPKKWKNIILLMFSLAFYFLGEREYTVLLVISCLINYAWGRIINKNKKKIYLAAGVLVNIALLFYFKYTNFFIDTFNNIFGLSLNTIKIVLPLGISFFTFQNVSYLIDVYRKDTECEKNLLTYMTYITLFPQLIAGPIVRYRDVKEQLTSRTIDTETFSEGIERFILGLGKKVLIADILYNMIETILTSDLTALSYWLIALMFVFQIYYDFSGYSDMAIGLGRMFGFKFLENFNYPLIADSVTEFWRRWHMSLSNFFKDYVYIPLGGNRCSNIVNMRNILIVWTLTGLWHGANWNFVLWGIYFGIFLLLEKFILKRHMKSKILNHLYTFLVITISFVIFNITDIRELFKFLLGMFKIGVDLVNFESIYYFKNCLIIILISTVGMSPYLKDKIAKLKKGRLKGTIEFMEVIYLMLIFFLSIAAIVSNSFSPFIYFRF